jgi:long-chain acyl-CoA synthetase
MENGVGFSYYNDPDETQRAYKGQRFSLGDLGYLDEDRYLFLSGRATDMIITGGTNVYPAEVEAALLAHPKVLDAGVIGIPDPDWGETVVAVVQLKPGIEPSPDVEAELGAFCRERLASYKCPRQWEFRDDLPRTEAGKLYKRQIRDEYLSTPTSKDRR